MRFRFSRYLFRPSIALLAVAVTPQVLIADDDPVTSGDDRQAWHYTTGDVEVTLYQVGDGEWASIRSDDRQPVFDEIDRTDEYVELQNRDSKLFVRLHDERAYWRRPSDEDWTTWFRGEWIPSPVDPGEAESPDPLLEHDDSIMADDNRQAWSYTEGDVQATIYRAGDSDWAAIRTDDKEPVYEELTRTEEYVELQNRDSQLIIKLTAERGYWRRTADEDWKTWVRGAWVPLPDSVAGLEPVTDHGVRLAYFVPSDRTPVNRYATRIRIIMEVVNQVYSGDLRRQGYPGRSIKFETNNEVPVVHLIRGQETARHYNNAPDYDAQEQWRRVVPEIREALGDTRRQVILTFVETYDDGPAEHNWPGSMARGAYYSADGGLAIYSGHLLRTQFCATTLEEQRRLFFDETPIQGRRAWGHGMNSPRCEFVEDGFGAVCHELGHAFGLPHDLRNDARFIMGNGFRNLRKNFGPREASWVGFSAENARLLSSSRYIADDLDITDNQPPEVEVTQIGQTRDSRTVRIRANDNTGLRALVLMDKNAGSIIGGRRLTGESQEFTQRLQLDLGDDGEVDLLVIVSDDGGNQTRVGMDVE